MVALLDDLKRSVRRYSRARQDRFWGWRLVAKRTMRPDRVVVLAPAIDEDGCFSKCVEDFAVEELISELSIEALIVAVLPRTPRLDVEGLHTDPA